MGVAESWCPSSDTSSQRDVVPGTTQWLHKSRLPQSSCMITVSLSMEIVLKGSFQDFFVGVLHVHWAPDGNLGAFWDSSVPFAPSTYLFQKARLCLACSDLAAWIRLLLLRLGSDGLAMDTFGPGGDGAEHQNYGEQYSRSNV